MFRLGDYHTQPFHERWKWWVSPYLNHFIQPDTIIPNTENPQSWNRYSYVQNNPIRFNDPTGHRVDDGCRGDGGCNVTADTIEHDLEKDRDFKDETERNARKIKCKGGDENYCPTIQTHPGEVIASTAAGLLLAGLGATAAAGATLAEGLMVGLSIGLDCATTYLSGSQCSAKNALITYAFSLVTGGLRGLIADKFMPAALEGPGGMLGLMGANMSLTFASNSFQRAAKGNPTMEDNVGSDIISGGVSTAVQMATGLQIGDPSITGPIGQAVSGLVSALLGPFNPDKGQTIIPAPQ